MSHALAVASNSTSQSLATPPVPPAPETVVNEYVPGYVAGVGDPVRAVTGVYDASLVTYLASSDFAGGVRACARAVLVLIAPM
jgi:hypothetical protein